MTPPAITDEEMIMWIDEATYQQMLTRWREAPCGDQMMLGEIGEYFIEVLRQKRNQYTHDQQVMISKRIGW